MTVLLVIVTGMCGRYVLARDTGEIAERFAVHDVDETAAPPGYNVAPTMTVPVVADRYGRQDARGQQRERILRSCQWGLVPSWAADLSGSARMINARVETVASKPAFRAAMARRRCLVPADGWYEWAFGVDGHAKADTTGKAGRSGKTAYYLTRSDGAPLAFAGLYEVWTDGTRRVVSCAVITTAATGEPARIHPRMPLTLAPELWSDWLDPQVRAPALPEPDPAAMAELDLRQVGPAVGNVRNQGPDLIRPVVPAPHQQPLDQSLDRSVTGGQ